MSDSEFQTIDSSGGRLKRPGVLRLTLKNNLGDVADNVSVDLCLLQAQGQNSQSCVVKRVKVQFADRNVNGSRISESGVIDLDLDSFAPGVYQLLYMHINGMLGHEPFNSLLTSGLRFTVDVSDPILEDFPFKIIPPPDLA